MLIQPLIKKQSEFGRNPGGLLLIIRRCEFRPDTTTQIRDVKALFLIDIFYLIVIILLSPWWLLKLATNPAFRAGISDRFILRDVGMPFAESIWLHGSSAGEIGLLRPIVSKFEELSAGHNIIISAFSISGYSAAKATFPQHCVIYFPADFSPVIKRFLKVLRPVLIVLVESEFWPNFIATATKSGIPVCVLNGRMSQKSFQAHRRTRAIPWALRKVCLFAVQSEEDALRFRKLGVPEDRIRITGNMKYDLQDQGDLEERQSLRRKLRKQYAIDEDMPVLVGGSIHRGEDLALAWVYSQLVRDGYRLRMVVVPRYPAESASVSHALEQHGLVALRKERLSDDEQNIFADPLSVLVVDTIGELKKFYAISDIAYVGGSLTYRGSSKGGHNLMEPAILGVAVMFGPYNYSFRETVRVLLDNDAGLLVHDQDEIFSNLKGLLDKPAYISDMGGKARQVILSNRGATDRNIRLLGKYLPF